MGTNLEQQALTLSLQADSLEEELAQTRHQNNSRIEELIPLIEKAEKFVADGDNILSTTLNTPPNWKVQASTARVQLQGWLHLLQCKPVQG